MCPGIVSTLNPCHHFPVQGDGQEKRCDVSSFVHWYSFDGDRELPKSKGLGLLASQKSA